MYFSEIETVAYSRYLVDADPLLSTEKPVAEIAWSALPDKVRQTIRSVGALSLEGDYPDSREVAKYETEIVVFSGNGKSSKIIARDRRFFEFFEDHEVHRRVATVFQAVEAAHIGNSMGEQIGLEVLGDLPKAPEIPAIPDWLERIEFARRPYLEEDFTSVLAKGSEAVAALRRVVEWASTNPQATVALPADYALLIHAFLLLGDFRDQGSFPSIIRFVSTPESVCDPALGDLITEELPEILARTYNGDFRLLTGLIENKEAYEFCRRSAVTALASLCWDGVLAREVVTSYLRDLFARTVSLRDHEISGAIVNVVVDLRLKELAEAVRSAFQEGVIDTFEIDEKCFHELLHSPEAPYRHIPPDRLLWRFQLQSYWLSQNYLSDQARAAQYQREELKKEQPHRETFLSSGLVGAGLTPYVAPPKVGRNEPCPCGSGKKYKKCCG